jgi:hypothetical protein
MIDGTHRTPANPESASTLSMLTVSQYLLALAGPLVVIVAGAVLIRLIVRRRRTAMSRSKR